MVEPHSSNFRLIIAKFWGVRIFRKCLKDEIYSKVQIQKHKTKESMYMYVVKVC